MAIDRRRTLALLGGALSSPFVLKLAEAAPAEEPVPPVEYVKIVSKYGAGFYHVSGSDVSLHAHGFQTAWVNDDPQAGSSLAYTRAYGLDGAPLSSVVQLGNPAGPADGVGANLVTCETHRNGSGLCVFNAPKQGASPAEAGEIWSTRLDATWTEVGRPTQVNTPLIGDYSSLFSTPLPNGNFASAFTYNTASGFDARVRICSPHGIPLFPERIYAHAGADQFVTNVAANDLLFLGYARVTNGDTQHFVQRMNNSVMPIGRPIPILPPNGQFIHGSPCILPGLDRDFYSVHFTSDSTGEANLHVQHFDEIGRRGASHFLGRQGVDNFGLAGNYPRCVTTPAGNILALTDGVQNIQAWLFTPNGKLLSRKAFRRRRRRRLRMQRLRRLARAFAAIWNETDVANSQSQWFAEVFGVANEPPPP